MTSHPSNDSTAMPADDPFYTDPWGSFRPSVLQAALIGLTRRTILQRGAARRHMSNLITGLGRPLDITFRSCNFRIEGRNNLIEYGLLTRPSYNASELDFLIEAARDGGTFIDIGCNIGLYSLPIARAAGSQGQVLSIDANPEMIRRITFNADASGLAQLHPIHLAVGDTDAKVDLNVPTGDVAIVNVTKSDDGAIQMRPLQQIVEDRGLSRIDALKIDIEGHEDQALVPFLQSAPQALIPKRIVIEQKEPGRDYPGCAAEFERLGYRLQGRTRNNSMYRLD